MGGWHNDRLFNEDFNHAREFALERLKRDLPVHLTYHDAWHTCEDVVPAVERLANLEGATDDDTRLILTAAYFHDLGFIVQYAGYEEISARMAEQVLPRMGYDSIQVQAVAEMILATRVPQFPQSWMAEILADADLDNLGREDFFPRTQSLRTELAAQGKNFTDLEWYQREIKFLREHRYFTGAARSLRDAQKQKNIEALLSLLEKAGNPLTPPTDWQPWSEIQALRKKKKD